MCDASTSTLQAIRHCANASCTVLLDSARSIYCSSACKQRCYRARHAIPRLAEVGTHAHCNLYLANLGLGGACVHCAEPLLLTELLGDGGATLLD